FRSFNFCGPCARAIARGANARTVDLEPMNTACLFVPDGIEMVLPQRNPGRVHSLHEAQVRCGGTSLTPLSDAHEIARTESSEKTIQSKLRPESEPAREPGV